MYNLAYSDFFFEVFQSFLFSLMCNAKANFRCVFICLRELFTILFFLMEHQRSLTIGEVPIWREFFQNI